jgi:general secretion pathway protein I
MSWSIGSAAVSRSRRIEGFTLVEVLVAFTIAALLLVAVLRILTVGLDGAERSEAYTRATIIAESTLDTLGVVTPLKDGDAAELSDGPFRIHAAVERYREPGAESQATQYLVLYRVSAAVSWREGRRERSVSLSTLRLGPQQ